MKSAPKKPARTAKPAPQYIHETTDDGDRHRIVVMRDGAIDHGAWFTFRQIAEHGELRACTSYYAGNLPEGVFRVVPLSTVAL